MAYYETIKVVAGDTKPDLEFTLRDAHTAATGKSLDEDEPSTWAPLDLSSSTIEVKFRSLGGEAVLDTMTCGILDQTTKPGQCFMQWNPTTLDVEAGTYEAEISVTDSAGSQTAVDKFKIKVRSAF
jgi:hypothetical protein|tara:strand:- start:1513 stop:1890 length:378 start_codon:yes stop_codon:yes gene_type:complete